MEDTLRADDPNESVINGTSLNPCFNGRYSQRFSIIAQLRDDES